MIYYSGIIRGNFVVPECSKCKNIVWPPSDYCNKCFGTLNLRAVSKIGKIIEFSKKEKTTFCVAEFENKIRIMGALKFNSKYKPKAGQKVLLENSAVTNGEYIFNMKLI